MEEDCDVQEIDSVCMIIALDCFYIPELNHFGSGFFCMTDMYLERGKGIERGFVWKMRNI